MAESNPYRYEEKPETGAPAPSQRGERKGPGCLFLGCLGVIGLFVLCIIGVVGGSYYWMKTMATKMTDDHPIELTQVAYSDEEIKELKDRLEAFSEAHEKGEASEDITLTADDLNALVNNEDWFETVEAPFYVELDGDQIHGEMSVPVYELIPLGMFEGRYLNGSATATAELIGGDLVVRIQSIEVKGEPIPKNIMDGIASEDIVDDSQMDPEFRRFIEKFETMEVKDGRIILKLKGK